MQNYLRWICQQPAEAPAVTEDDGKNCGICFDRDMTDWALCDAYSREWGRTGRCINW